MKEKEILKIVIQILNLEEKAKIKKKKRKFRNYIDQKGKKKKMKN